MLNVLFWLWLRDGKRSIVSCDLRVQLAPHILSSMALVAAPRYLRRSVSANDWPCVQMWQEEGSNLLYWDLNYLRHWLSESLSSVERHRTKWIQRYFKPCLASCAVLNLSHLRCAREDVAVGEFNQNAATSQAICAYLMLSKFRHSPDKSAAFNQLLASMFRRCVQDLQHEEVIVLPRGCSLVVDRSGQVVGLSPYFLAVHGNIEATLRNFWNIFVDQGVLQGAWAKNCPVAVRDIALFVAEFPRFCAHKKRAPTTLQRQSLEDLANALIPWLGFHFDRCISATATDAAPPALRRPGGPGRPRCYTLVAPEASSLSESACVCMLAPQMVW